MNPAIDVQYELRTYHCVPRRPVPALAPGGSASISTPWAVGGALPGIAEIIVGKQRNGPTVSRKLAFIKEFTRFENLEWRAGQQDPGPVQIPDLRGRRSPGEPPGAP